MHSSACLEGMLPGGASLEGPVKGQGIPGKGWVWRRRGWQGMSRGSSEERQLGRLPLHLAFEVGSREGEESPGAKSLCRPSVSSLPYRPAFLPGLQSSGTRAACLSWVSNDKTEMAFPLLCTWAEAQRGARVLCRVTQQRWDKNPGLPLF